MMKDEAGRKIIKEFAGLRAKLYSHTMFEGKEEKRHKGINREEYNSGRLQGVLIQRKHANEENECNQITEA